MSDKVTLFSWFTSLPPWARGVVIVGGAGVTVFGVVSIVKALNAKKAQEKAQAELKGFTDDLDALAKSGIHPTFQETQYKLWADAIHQQFQGCDPRSRTYGFFDDTSVGNYSGSGQVVFNVLSSLSNDADFLALATAWGRRSFDACGWFTGDVTDVTLAGAIEDELDSSEVAGLNKILAAKGIQYRL